MTELMPGFPGPCEKCGMIHFEGYCRAESDSEKMHIRSEKRETSGRWAVGSVPTSGRNVCQFCGEEWQGAHTCAAAGGDSSDLHPIKYELFDYETVLAKSDVQADILAELKAIRELLERMLQMTGTLGPDKE